jgi:hypothetical protein
MSNNTDSTGKLGKVTQTLKDHPVLAGLALFTGTLLATKAITRHQATTEIVELPEPTDKTSAVRNVSEATLDGIRKDDAPLKDLTGNGDIEGGGDPISKAIRP